MAKRLERPEFSNEKPLNYRRSDPYVPDLGFHVAVDGAFRLSKAAFHVAVTSLFPPGTFYSSKASDDVVFTQQPDITSQLQAPRWRDGLHARQHVIHEPNLVVIVDVRALEKPGRPALRAQGWSVLPLFIGDQVNSGVFQLPLYQGTPPLALLLVVMSWGTSFFSKMQEVPMHAWEVLNVFRGDLFDTEARKALLGVGGLGGLD